MVHHNVSCWARRFNRRYGKKNLPTCIFLTDRVRVPDVERTIKQLPQQSLIIIRDYDMPNRAGYVKTIVALSKRCGHKVLVAGDEALAVRYKADGVHCPEWMGGKAQYYKSRHPKWIISVAAHSLQAVTKLQETHIDMVLVSPVFLTKSHPDAVPLGVMHFRNICLRQDCPIYPLGGVEGVNILQLKTVPIPGIATIGALAPRQ